MSSEVTYVPLIDGENGSEAVEPLNSKRPTQGVSRCLPGRIMVKRILVGTIASVVFFCLIVLALLIKNGSFEPINHDDVRIVNGSVVEPNTHMTFPLQRERALQDGPAATNIQRLVGVALETSTKAHVTLRIFCLALYMDRAEARRALQPYKQAGMPEMATPAYDKFVDVITSGEMTLMLEYRMVMSMPSTVMQERWLEYLTPLWREFGVEDTRSHERCFLAWFENKPLRAGEVYLWEFNSKTKAMRMQRNGKFTAEACAQPQFARGFFTEALRRRGEADLNLLSTLWAEEYDAIL